MKKLTLLVVAVALVATAPALASVTIDDAGYGFVGKGDIQAPLGWDNAKLQAEANNIKFWYTEETVYDVPCKKDAGKQTIRHTFKRKTAVDSAVSYEPRKVKGQKQVTGFNLKGFTGEPIETGNDPACPGGFEPDGDPVVVSSNDGLLVAETVDGLVELPETV